ncbi:enoyl-CoA hydratase [Aneurinibacillus sp. Ricciae_BoGa-3]|uniref:enoyl-CoA hydratase/isomerase family protein n=1 Tax=Aneurinibacillus sp. Ricciae_BoGa-3 TaxID=3022697 RepID=UPI002341E179|nr:enoyl-CoA hydratase [Aneurinibacillus sp. Ricciae_BoGa-3]WCK56369.1 enoyl-CoA hydratase [Aneurinibacillus sp. Ricciae_BoGa-3]
MENNDLLITFEGPILSLKLNRPTALNAFSPAMIEGLIASLEEARNNEHIRVVLLSGAGRSFSAGGDVKGMGESSPGQVYEHVGKLNQLIKLMKEVEKPIIAVVHGFAAGAGFNLALACDLIIAAEDSKFVLSFSQVGLISDGGGSFFLPRLIGIHRAKELLFSAEPLEAAKAYEWGIVNRLYPLEELQTAAMEYAKKLANGPSRAYGLLKKIADQSLVSGLEDILEQERITQAMMVTTEDHEEGVRAFKEKRKPAFKGR